MPLAKLWRSHGGTRPGRAPHRAPAAAPWHLQQQCAQRSGGSRMPTWRSRPSTSGCARSQRANATTACGLRRTASVSSPPAPYPMYLQVPNTGRGLGPGRGSAGAHRCSAHDDLCPAYTPCIYSLSYVASTQKTWLRPILQRAYPTGSRVPLTLAARPADVTQTRGLCTRPDQSAAGGRARGARSCAQCRRQTERQPAPAGTRTGGMQRLKARQAAAWLTLG